MTDYEKLKKDGYTETKFALNYTKNPAINVYNIYNNQTSQDITIISKNGENTQDASINAKEFILEDGIYVSLEEIKIALDKILKTNHENKIAICKKTKKQMPIEEASKNILKQITDFYMIKIEGNETKREEVYISTKDNNRQEFIRNGLLKLNQQNIELPNGEYVNKIELQTALKNYLIMQSPLTPNIDISKKEKELPKKEVKKVKNVSKKKWKLYPIILTGVAMIASGFKSTKIIQTIEIEKEPDLKYEINAYEDENIYETKQEARNRVLRKLKIGSEIETKPGTIYHESSDYQYGGATKSGTIKENENCLLERIAILKDGEILEVAEEIGTSVADITENVMIENNIAYEDLEVMANIEAENYGWIHLDELIDKEEMQPKILDTKKKFVKKYSGIEKKFQGSISLNSPKKEKISLKVLDKNNKLLAKDRLITGSDGLKYIISKLSLKENNQKVSVETGRKIKWDIQNLYDTKAKLIALLGISSTILLNKEKIRKRKITKD